MLSGPGALPHGRNLPTTEKCTRSPAELPHILREHWTGAGGDFRTWRADVRKDASLLRRTTAIRTVLWIVLGVAAPQSLIAGIRTFFPSGSDAQIEQLTPGATLPMARITPVSQATYTTKTVMDFAA